MDTLNLAFPTENAVGTPVAFEAAYLAPTRPGRSSVPKISPLREIRATINFRQS
jgi:hypothetical protein